MFDKFKSVFALILLMIVSSTGCDLGTYQKRLDEHRSGVKKEAGKADSTSSDDGSDNDSGGDDPFQ